MTHTDLIDELSAIRLRLDAVLAALYAQQPRLSNNGVMANQRDEDVCKDCKVCAIRRAAEMIEG